MKRIEKTALVGRGAVGILYAMQLKEAGLDPVFLVDEQRKERYEREPLHVNGAEIVFPYRTRTEAPDLLLVCVKATGLEQAIETIARSVDSHTILLPCINGITSEEILRRAFPENPVLRTIVQGMDSRFLEGVCTYTVPGEILYGPETDQEQELCALLDAFFAEAGIRHRNCPDIVLQQWNKLMLNCAVNQICAAHGATYGTVLQEPLKTMLVQAMREVKETANALDIPLTEEQIRTWVDVLAGLDPDSMPSMAQDRIAGRKTEVSLFSGTVCPLAKKAGVDTPVLDALYGQILEMEKRTGVL